VLGADVTVGELTRGPGPPSWSGYGAGPAVHRHSRGVTLGLIVVTFSS